MTYQVSHAQGQLLAQVRPAVATPVLLFQAGNLRVEVTLIMVGLNSTPLTLSLYHDDDGVTFDGSTIIGNVNYQSLPVPPAITPVFQAQHPGSGILMAAQSALGVQIDAINNAVISVYGITETLAERVRGFE